jgi:hypothetical protein
VVLTSSFPALTLAQVEPSNDEDGVLRSVMRHPPTSSLAQSNIWETAAREELLRPQFKKSDLDYRRQKVRNFLRLINVIVLSSSSASLARNFDPLHRIIVYHSYSCNAQSLLPLPPTNHHMALLSSYPAAGQCTSSRPSYTLAA